MDFERKAEDTKTAVVDTEVGIETQSTETGSSIYLDPEKEASARRKFDKYLVPASLIFIILSALDRNNIGNAVVFGFSRDLGLVGNQFNNIQTLSSFCSFAGELPWTLAVRRFGARKALGTAFLLWSICTLGTAFIHTYGQAIAVRMILCACESGLSPGFAFLYSTIYPPEEAGKRIMTTNLAQCISGAFGGLFAYAIQTMGTKRGLAAWRWLFIVEFCVTIFIGGIGWIFIPKSAETAWYLTEEEKETMRQKKKRDYLLRGGSKFEWKWAKESLMDPFVYLLGTAFFTSSVAINGFNVFLPSIINGLGYTSLQANYLTIPVYIFGAISLVIQVYFSDQLKRRSIFIIGCCVPVAVGYLICVGTASPGAGYAGMFILVVGLYPISTLAVTWATNTFAPDSKRAIAMPIVFTMADISSMVSSQLYPSTQKPRYVQGNAVSAGLTCIAAFLYTASWFMLRRRNMKKAKLLAEGATTNNMEGDRSLDTMYML
ncbi:high-affinity nicotinic acid transporter-like protein [Penicillium robsamsonii]|uniref:high-affinity nicotinic acid transporter-like protein n=1 Tax=Penicillium robsamsonii TaxID=1792511 RepID=UPI002546DAAD|nr:high-affinity nicotinic acid transporter-like protein [Penicillium robsamsonii]KAJ5836650.1 high-affinity nicotinic acid transporter-like protein [Penicillium robsamsonii]